MIPRTLHQVWLGDKSKRPIAWMDTWRIRNPKFQYKLWTEENMPESLVKDKFDTCPTLVGKADILRYQILLQEGGICVDADSECTRSLDDFFLENDSFCTWENEWVRPGLMTPAFMGSGAGNPVMKACLDQIAQTDMNFPPLEEWQVIGPLLLTRTVCKLKYTPMTIYPSYYFAPHHYSGLDYDWNGKSYAKHYWGSTPNRV